MMNKSKSFTDTPDVKIDSDSPDPTECKKCGDPLHSLNIWLCDKCTEPNKRKDIRGKRRYSEWLRLSDIWPDVTFKDFITDKRFEEYW